jgi:hypothetical protein
MNLKLNEWNEACKYAETVCCDLTNRGYNTKPKEYTMYDGRKGLYLQVFDANRKFYKEYATGIQTSLSGMKKAINEMVNRIINEL